MAEPNVTHGSDSKTLVLSTVTQCKQVITEQSVRCFHGGMQRELWQQGGEALRIVPPLLRRAAPVITCTDGLESALDAKMCHINIRDYCHPHNRICYARAPSDSQGEADRLGRWLFHSFISRTFLAFAAPQGRV